MRAALLAMLLAPLPVHWLAPASAEAAPAEQAVSVDRIEFSGVTAISQPEVEEALEVAPGDRLDRARVVRTAENLVALYKSRGYERVGISSRIVRRKSEEGALESVLEFAVSEGQPTRIASVRITPVAGSDKLWRSIEGDILSRVGLAAADVLDQERVSAGRRAVQDALAARDFIGARIEELRVTDSPAPALPSVGGAPPPEAGRWVEVEMRVDLGDRVSFGFRGNQAFTLAALNGLVEEQRLLGFGKDYAGAIRGRIEEAYRAEGYARVRIVPYAIERPRQQERHVTFEIHEGSRLTIESLDFDGNAVFSDDELRSRFEAVGSPLLQHGYYSERDVQKAAELLVEWMKSKGYLAAKLVTISAQPSTAPRRAGRKPDALRLTVYLYEGDQTIVGSVSFTGLSAFTPAEVRRFLGLEATKPLNLFAFTEGLEALKAAYRGKGYLGIRIVNEGTDTVIRYSEENRRADVSLELNEGYQFQVSSIQVDGLGKTQETVVRRELLVGEGGVLSETALAESEARLRRLGIFSVVAIRLVDDPDRPDAKIVRISVQEGTPGVIAGGPGFRNDFGARLFGQVAYTNLWGLNHTLSFTTNVNHRIEDFRFVEYQSQLAYTHPYFLGTDATFRPALTATGNQYIRFDATTLNASLTWEKRLLREPALTGTFTYSLEYVNQFNASDTVENQRLRIGSIIPSLRLDTRDNPLSPTSGFFATLTYELAAPYLFSQAEPYSVGYSRIQGRIDRLFPLPFGTSLYLSYRGGFERSSEPTDPRFLAAGAIPLIKQFALGGAGSLRGFREQALNVQDKFVYGTASYSNYRTQLDFPVSGALRVGPFLDAANLMVDNTSPGMFLFDGLRFGAGFGIHYQTPVGPVNLDLGFNLDRKPDEEPWRIYFSIGLI